jgi:hypothetical protein
MEAMNKMMKLFFATLFLHVTFLSPILANANDMPILTEAHQKIIEEFQKIDAAMKNAAYKLGIAGLNGDGARSYLAELCEKFTFAIDCSAVNSKGTIVTVEPSPHRHLEETDISTQEHVKRIIKKHKPVMSSVFKAIEGFEAVVLEYPVFNPHGEYIGYVGLLFKPETFFDQILPPLTKSIPADILVMEKEGRIIYDANISEIGLNLFTSLSYQSYSELQKLGRRIAVTKEGNGSYQYKVHGENIVAAKNAYWKSVNLYGTEWRVVGIRIEKDKSGSKMKQKSPSINPEERLDALAAEGKLIKNLSNNDKNEAMQLFKAYYKTTPGIYAIEWIDENGANRFGYPAENSLIDYDYHQKRETGDQEILDILTSRKKASMELPLTEGGTGIFNFTPVSNDERYLGMIYIIRLK